MSSVPFEKLKLLSDDEIKNFSGLFTEISAAVLSSIEFKELPPCVKTYYENLWLYSIPHGRKIRAEVLILAFKFFSSGISKDTITLSYILGWILEILHSASKIGNALKGKIKNGKSYCFIQDDIGVAVANDMIFIENSAYILAKKYFSNKPYYIDLINFLHVTSFRNSFGKGLDLLSEMLREFYTSPKCCMTLYEAVTRHRSTHNIFYAPVTLAAIMSGVKREKSFLAIKDITSRIGAYYQAQQDFMDVFGLPEQTGRIGTAITNGNYTWPVVIAFERANDAQRKILMENYGRADFLHVHAVKIIFDNLNIEKLYWEYEYESRSKINVTIENSVEYPQPLFQLLMAAIIASSS